MKTLEQFLNMNISDATEQEIEDILDKIDVGNVETLSDDQFSKLMKTLIELTMSDKITHEVRDAVINKLGDIKNSLKKIRDNLINDINKN